MVGNYREAHSPPTRAVFGEKWRDLFAPWLMIGVPLSISSLINVSPGVALGSIYLCGVSSVTCAFFIILTRHDWRALGIPVSLGLCFSYFFRLGRKFVFLCKTLHWTGPLSALGSTLGLPFHLPLPTAPPTQLKTWDSCWYGWLGNISKCKYIGAGLHAWDRLAFVLSSYLVMSGLRHNRHWKFFSLLSFFTSLRMITQYPALGQPSNFSCDAVHTLLNLLFMPLFTY